MTMNTDSGMSLDYWPEADWALGYYLRTSAPLESGESSWTGGNPDSLPVPQLDNNPSVDAVSQTQLVSATFFDSAYTNQFGGDGPPAAEWSPLIYGCGDLPVTIEDNNGTIVPSSIQLSPMERLPLSSLNTHEESQNEGEDLRQLMDIKYLTNLPPSTLKEIAKKVAEALILAPQKKQKKSLESRGERGLQVHGGKTLQNTAIRSSILEGMLRCEHPACNTTFRRNKDRLRHIRQKHTTNVEVFSCPVADCPMGLGHQFHRSDKLRDHLRGQKISSYQWTCFLPGCLEIAPNKASLYDHLRRHDYRTRFSNRELLKIYGFASDPKDYLTAKYTCSIQGCPFGTDYEAAISRHLSIPHDGPFCPCPIPSCGEVFQDRQSASTHLTRKHDYSARERFEDDIKHQHLYTREHFFACPICPDVFEDTYTSKVRGHCQKKHDHEQLLRGWEALLDAWSFSFGTNAKDWGSRLLRDISGRDEALAYMILPKTELKKLRSKGDFEQAGSNLRASALELSKDEPKY